MKYIGKRGEFVYHKVSESELMFDSAIIHMDRSCIKFRQGDILCGGAALSILNSKIPYKDIDIWTTLDPIKEARHESPFAFNCKLYNGLNIQYMKIKPNSPTDIISNFDLDICKCALYLNKDKEFIFVSKDSIQYLRKTKVLNGKQPILAFNEFSLARMEKYSNKFGISMLEMFYEDDIKKAFSTMIGNDDIPVTQKELLDAVRDFEANGSEMYVLASHLKHLFGLDDPVDDFDPIEF